MDYVSLIRFVFYDIFFKVPLSVIQTLSLPKLELTIKHTLYEKRSEAILENIRLVSN